jgi:hypothetical protein
MDGHVEAMEEAVSDSRARRIYRKGAVYGWKEEDEGSERGSEATVRVDSARISKASIAHNSALYRIARKPA